MRPKDAMLRVVATLAGAALMSPSLAQAAADSPASQTSEPAASASSVGQVTPSVSSAPAFGGLPIYKPPSAGKPARSVGGASRGPGDGFPELYALVPNHVGQTASEQPSVFWYVDDTPPPGSVLEFTLIDEDGIEPMVDAPIAAPKQAGIYRIRLSDYGVKLVPGAEYEWSVAIIVDPEERSKDIIATGWIERVERSSALTARLEAEGQARSVHVYADEGLWYDALASADDELESKPGDPEAVKTQAVLLRQVGLEEVASAQLL